MKRIMRIQGPTGTGSGRLLRPVAARRGSSGTFSVSEQTRKLRHRAAHRRLRTVGGIDALIALQGVEDATERRRQARSSAGGSRSMRSTSSRSGSWAGTLTPATLTKLQSAAAFLKDGSGEAGSRRRAGRDRASRRGRNRQDGVSIAEIPPGPSNGAPVRCLPRHPRTRHGRADFIPLLSMSRPSLYKRRASGGVRGQRCTGKRCVRRRT